MMDPSFRTLRGNSHPCVRGLISAAAPGVHLTLTKQQVEFLCLFLSYYEEVEKSERIPEG